MAIKGEMIYYKCFYDCNISFWGDATEMVEAVALHGGSCSQVLARKNPLYGVAMLLGCRRMGLDMSHYSCRVKVCV